MHLAPQDWPCILPAIQAVLNNSPSSHRAGQTPLPAFTGHARDSPLALTVLHPTANKSLSFIKAQQLAEISKFTTQVEQLHKEVSTQVSRQRRKQMESHNANTNLVQPNFYEGEFFDPEEGTMEPLYEKWVDVPRMLTVHLEGRAEVGDELAQKVLIKIGEFENDQGDHHPHTIGDTNSPNKVYQKLLRVPIHPNHPY
jgi:hypothetical protein